MGVVGLVACASSSQSPSAPAELPCDVASVLETTCQTCHASPPREDAPLPLVTYADTQASYTALPAYDRVPTWRVMGDAIRVGDMPRSPVKESFTEAERATLLTWVGNGAPPRAPGALCP